MKKTIHKLLQKDTCLMKGIYRIFPSSTAVRKKGEGN